jgi:hypothetical protein
MRKDMDAYTLAAFSPFSVIVTFLTDLYLRVTAHGTCICMSGISSKTGITLFDGTKCTASFYSTIKKKIRFK